MAQKQFIIDGGFKTNADSVVEGNLDLSGNKLTGLGSAVAATDAVNKSTLEAAISNVDVTAELAVVTSAYQAADTAEETARLAGDAAVTTAMESYADTAEADAIASAEAKDVVRATAASADATAKADQALVDAKAYADTAEADAVASSEAKDVVRATAASADATAKADQALVDAKAYADTADATLTSDLATEKGRIDAIMSASTSDADTFAEVVALVNSVDTTNDNGLAAEISARIAGDSSTLSSAQSYADTAEADAIASAEAKDVVRATAAASDATTKADQALVDAKAYADTAEADAVASAEAKDVVRATAAASDATTKANQALVDAKAYADTAEADAVASAEAKDAVRATAAASDATSKANAAQSAAEATASTDATTKADAAEAAAISAAAADATAKSNQALVDAKAYSDASESASNAYTDTELAALVNAAPGSLDTLNELAAAMGDDANFAASTATNIATAKGEAIATAAADATAKANAAEAYTDTRETAITSAYQSYANTAEADAVASAEAKDAVRATAAASDATSKANAAQSAAEATAEAYTDARETAITSAYQAYANQAEADAESAAASDATSKANAAQSAAEATAEAYTDARETAITSAYQSYANQAEADAESAAASDATSKANAAQSAAISAASSDATSKANAAQSAAISTAASDATSKANAAQAAAIAAVTNGAGAAFDTLVEIQNAMATDSELNSAISAITTVQNANQLSTARTISLGGDLSGSASFNGTSNITITAAVADDSHNHTIANVDGLQSALNGKQASGSYASTGVNLAAGNGLTGGGTIASSRTFHVGGGNGISVSADGVAMSGSYSGSFTATGDITAYSDESLKTNIQTIDGALGKVEAVRGVTFDRIEDGSTSTGVVAQELLAVLPEAVHTDANGVHSVAYGNITGLLIEALKELSAEVKELKK